MLLAWLRHGRRRVLLERSQALEMGILLAATLYALTIPFKGELGLVTLTGYPPQTSLTQAVKDEITASCPACTTKTLELPPTAIGTTMPSAP